MLSWSPCTGCWAFLLFPCVLQLGQWAKLWFTRHIAHMWLNTVLGESWRAWRVSQTVEWIWHSVSLAVYRSEGKNKWNSTAYTEFTELCKFSFLWTENTDNQPSYMCSAKNIMAHSNFLSSIHMFIYLLLLLISFY